MIFKIKFWGVWGSIFCLGLIIVCYGGNIICVEMAIGREWLIFDVGIGIKMLGDSFLS